LRGKGFAQSDIERLCLQANQKHYEDLLDDAIVLDRAQRYAESTSSSPSGASPIVAAQALTEPSLLDQIDHTDAGNVALLFNLTAGDLRYVVERKQWIVWRGDRWQLDKGSAATHQKMLKVSAHHRKLGDKRLKEAEAAGNPDQRKNLSDAGKVSLKWAVQCRNKNRLDAMLAIAQRDSRFLIEANQLDSDPWLLGVGNGVVDLRTGVLRPDSKTDLVLKRCATEYDPHARAPRWSQFIEEITAAPGAVLNGKVIAINRPHLADYLQKSLGYCLTGRVSEHIMFIAIGRGANGKNVLLDTFKSIAGDYCETIAPEVLMATRLDGNAEQASPSTRKLAGARCAISSESKDGQRLDIAVVKRHTGGGTMTARALHENPMTFEITHKLWLMTNHSPRVDHMDEATKGRLHLIPFDMKWNRPGETRPDPTLPNADKQLMDTLAAEKAGILLWLVAGAVKYHAEGLVPPAEVVGFTTSYIESQDTLARWLSEGCEVCSIDLGLLSKELLLHYSDFCAQEDETLQIDKPNNLSRKLKALGYASKKTKNGVRFGLKTKSAEEPVQARQVLEAILDGWDKSSADVNVING
jgi:putative DNA primase/helicase